MREVFCFLLSLSPFFSITLAEGLVLLGLAWAGFLFLKGKRQRFPDFFFALLAFAALSFLSALFSLDSKVSLRDTKELFLYLIPGVVLLCSKNAIKRGLVLGAGLAAFLGLIRDIFVRQDRLTGFVGHYMTEGGLMMMALLLVVALMLFEGLRWEYAFSVVAVLLALLLTLTRSAWVGALVGLVFLLYRKKKALAGLLIPAVLAGLMLAPSRIRDRALSIFSLSNPTNVERLNMWKVGLRMARLRPIFGIGQNMASRLYPQYKKNNLPPPEIPHLHNTYLQLAVERGFLGLLAFLVFVFLVIKQLWNRKDPEALGALAVMLGFLASGFFEYNFGDSEVKIALLIIISLPFIHHKEVLNDKNTQKASVI